MNLTRYLLEHTSAQILCVDKLTYAGNLASLEDVLGERARFFELDICDTDAMSRLLSDTSPSAIMHLAAESHVDRSIDGPEAFVETNVVGTFRLLAEANRYFNTLSGERRASFRFLHVSTDEVFGSLADGEPGFNEETRYDPHSPYSASKAASDHFVRAWGDTYGLPVLITNCSNNYGPYQFPEKLIPVVILKALAGQQIPVYGKGENIRDWLHVEDHCKALHRVLAEGVVGETYAIGGDNEKRNVDLVREICSELDAMRPRADGSSYASLIRFVDDRPGHDMRYAIDASKIRQKLRWAPDEQASQRLKETVQWYLENDAWWKRILSGEYRMQRQGL